MNTQKSTHKLFLAILALFAGGVLTGCQYCEPLLMATLVIGAVYKGIAYSPFAQSKVAGIKQLDQPVTKY